MSMTFIRPAGDEVAKVYGTYWAEEEIKSKVVKGTRLDILCTDGLNYIVDVKDFDPDTGVVHLHFYRWSSKSDYKGSLYNLYVIKEGKFSVPNGLTERNDYKYIPQATPTPEKTKAPTLKDGSLSAKRYDDSYFKKQYSGGTVSRRIEASEAVESHSRTHVSNSVGGSPVVRQKRRSGSINYVESISNSSSNGMDSNGGSNAAGSSTDHLSDLTESEELNSLPPSIMGHKLLSGLFSHCTDKPSSSKSPAFNYCGILNANTPKRLRGIITNADAYDHSVFNSVPKPVFPEALSVADQVNLAILSSKSAGLSASSSLSEKQEVLSVLTQLMASNKQQQDVLEQYKQHSEVYYSDKYVSLKEDQKVLAETIRKLELMISTSSVTVHSNSTVE